MVDLEWSTNTDWTNAQSTTNIDINSGTFELADAIPDSGVSRYGMEDEGDTTTITDEWGNNDLTANGPTYTTNSKVGSHARDYDGTDDTDDASNANITTGAFSVLGWVIDRAGSNRHYFTGGSSNADSTVYWLGTDENGEFYFRGLGVGGDILDATTTDIRDGTYHFFGVAVDPAGGEVRTNVDGSNDYTRSGSVSSPDLTDTQIQLGNRFDGFSGRFHDGILDVVEYRDKALSTSEFASVYNDTK